MNELAIELIIAQTLSGMVEFFSYLGIEPQIAKKGTTAHDVFDHAWVWDRSIILPTITGEELASINKLAREKPLRSLAEFLDSSFFHDNMSDSELYAYYLKCVEFWEVRPELKLAINEYVKNYSSSLTLEDEDLEDEDLEDEDLKDLKNLF